MYDFSILMSMKPRFTQEIFVTAKKDVELRKSKPARYRGQQFRVYVYESGSGCVIGHFICDRLIPISCLKYESFKKISTHACVSTEEYQIYNPTWAYWICERTLYSKPIPYKEFALQHGLGNRPPQSWCYIKK